MHWFRSVKWLSQYVISWLWSDVVVRTCLVVLTAWSCSTRPVRSRLTVRPALNVTAPVHRWSHRSLTYSIDVSRPAYSGWTSVDADCQHCKAATSKLKKAYRKKPCDQSRSAWQRQFSSQQELFQQKLVAYWTATIDVCGSNSKALWSKLWSLLQPQSDSDTQLSADDFAHYGTLRRKLTASVR